MEQIKTSTALTVVSGGIVYQVIGPVEIAAQIPVTTTTTTVATTGYPRPLRRRRPGPRTTRAW
jgi:hypothetical protein